MAIKLLDNEIHFVEKINEVQKEAVSSFLLAKNVVKDFFLLPKTEALSSPLVIFPLLSFDSHLVK